ncbi:unnamed protein product, partial [Ectocarpus fasciculatus]
GASAGRGRGIRGGGVGGERAVHAEQLRLRHGVPPLLEGDHGGHRGCWRRPLREHRQGRRRAAGQ